MSLHTTPILPNENISMNIHTNPDCNRDVILEGKNMGYKLDSNTWDYKLTKEDFEPYVTADESLEFERERICGMVDHDCWDYALKKEKEGIPLTLSIQKWYSGELN